MNLNEFEAHIRTWLLNNVCPGVLLVERETDSCTLQMPQEGYLVELTLDLLDLFYDAEQSGLPPLYRRLEKILRESRMSRRPRTTEECALSLETEDQLLFRRLCSLRRALAEREHLSAFIVFSNQTMLDMVERKPRTLEEFLLVPGIGQKKLKKYGEAFLKEIQEYLASVPA